MSNTLTWIHLVLLDTPIFIITQRDIKQGLVRSVDRTI